MSKTYRPYEPGQQLLVSAALQEWLPEDHLAYFISDIVDQLDLSEITARYERERRGGPPYHPRMMVKVLVYGYCIGVASSRRIARRLHAQAVRLRVQTARQGTGRPQSIDSPARVTRTPILVKLLGLGRLHQGKSVVADDLRRHPLRLLTVTQAGC